MVILKKVRGSTLMETLVATVLIVIIFMLASLTLNHVFHNIVKSNTNNIDNYLNELQYKFYNKVLNVPYIDTFEMWDISINYITIKNKKNVIYKATNSISKKVIIIEYELP